MEFRVVPRFFQANLNEIPNISLFSTLPFISLYRNLKKKKEREIVESNFSKYLLPVQDIYIYIKERGKKRSGEETSRLRG